MPTRILKIASFTNDLEYPSEDIFCAAPPQLSTVGGCHPSHSTIDTLFDDVLLYIFNSYRQAFYSVCYDHGAYDHGIRVYKDGDASSSHSLAILICGFFAILNQLSRRWPALALSLFVDPSLGVEDGGEDVIGALEYRDRIAEIHFGEFRRPQLENCVALMQNPFPALKFFEFGVDEETMFVIIDTFLGGSAPLLQEISLGKIRFPGLSKLFSSTSNLVISTSGGFQ